MSTLPGFAFDMDGTLMDTIRIWHEAEQRVLEETHVELSKEQRDQLNALTLEEAAAFFHENFGIGGSAAEVVESITGHMLEFYRNEAVANPGAIEFVRTVFEAGAPMCVLSSSPLAFQKAGLEHAGLKQFFSDDLLLSAEDMGMTKRAAATFDHACSLLGTPPTQTWLFDDSWYALATAREVGLHTVGVFSSDMCGTHDELRAYCDVVVDGFDELSAADFLL